MQYLIPRKFIFITILFVLFLTISDALATDKVNDSDALRGVTETKAIFDIHVNKTEMLVLYLEVIAKTYDDLKRQGQAPLFVIAFRGPTLRFITNENWSFSIEDQERIEKTALLIQGLLERGVMFEACSIAANLFKVDPKTYVPGVKPVGNTFVSLIGYQAKGYSLVPVD